MTDYLKSEEYIRQHRDETIDIICRFAKTDLLFFWDENEQIFLRQQKIWLPFLDKFEREKNVRINISKTLQVPDNEDYIVKLKSKLQDLSDKELTGVVNAAALLKSVILGLFLLDKKIKIDDIFNAAFLEDFYQNEQWGFDEEDLAKRDIIKTELQKIREYLV